MWEECQGGGRPLLQGNLAHEKLSPPRTLQ